MIDGFFDSKLPAMPVCELTLEDRKKLVAQYGASSLSFSAATQELLKYFGDSRGFIAYQTKAGSIVVLSDPVCADDDLHGLLSDFLNYASNASFAQINSVTADVLRQLNYKICALGPDFVLDLENYDFSGSNLQTVRASHRWLLKRDYEYVEMDDANFDAKLITGFSDNFRANKQNAVRLMRFLNPPPDLVNKSGVRRFYVFEPDGQIACFMELHAMQRSGQTFGYSVVIKQRRIGTTNHAEIGLTKHVGDVLRSEGFKQLRLGLAPFFALEDSDIKEAGLVGKFARYLCKLQLVNNKIFNFQGHGKFKRRFHGREEMTYLAWRNRPFLRETIALLRLSKVI